MAMTKIYFVGLHNKPGKIPLCSSTKSGKLIDRIIKEGGFTNWQKTNLFNVEYYPVRREDQDKLAGDWYSRIEPQNDDIAVVLGAATNEAMPRYGWIKFIAAAHPASKRSHVDMDAYVKDVIIKIKSQLK